MPRAVTIIMWIATIVFALLGVVRRDLWATGLAVAYAITAVLLTRQLRRDSA